MTKTKSTDGEFLKEYSIGKKGLIEVPKLN